MPVPRQNMMFPATSLRNNFSGLRVSMGAAAAGAPSGSECNDALPRPPASRLDTVNHNSHSSRLVLNTPEDHLAAALRFGQPTKGESKISPPVIKAGGSRSAETQQKSGAVSIPGTKSQNIEDMRENMREELLKRLSKTNLGGNKQSPEMQMAFAKRLEEILYKTSKTLKLYADTTTLDRRLQALMAAMQKRKAKATLSNDNNDPPNPVVVVDAA